MSKMTMPMAMFGGLALIAVALSLPTIVQLSSSEAHAALDMGDFNMIRDGIQDIVDAIRSCN